MAIPGLEFKKITAANNSYSFGSAQTGNRLFYSPNDTDILEYRSPKVKDEYGFALNRLGENIDQMA